MSSSTSLSKNKANDLLPATVQEAFTALSTYDRGSPRAALLPIDDAVAQSKTNQHTGEELERRLIAVLSSGSEVAREYACVKLATIGAEASIPGLSTLLAHPRLATCARTALESLPSPQASKALRNALDKLGGAAKIGAITSLGARRDADSTRALAALLRNADPAVQSAAAAALGEIGTNSSAKALRAFLPKAPEPIRQQLGDACLVCAERLLAQNRRSDAASLYSALAASNMPRHILNATKRGLAGCAPRKPTA